MSTWQNTIKRLTDLIIATVAVLLVLPIGAVVAATLLTESKASPIVRRPRLGREGSPFKMLTFRTTRGGGESDELTRAGVILLRTSLYKLPALLNVIAGQMSLVGPSPMRPADKADLSNGERLVQTVRPGLVSPASRAHAEAERHALGNDPAAARDMRRAALAIELSYVRRSSLRVDAGILGGRLLDAVQSPDRYRRGRRYTLAERLAAARAGPMLIDGGLAALMAIVAVGLRIDRNNIVAAAAEYWILIPFAFVIRPAGFAITGVYLRVWRYPTLRDALLVVMSLALGSLVMALAIFIVLKPWNFPGTVGFPRSAILIEFVLSLLVLGGMRLVSRMRSDIDHEETTRLRPPTKSVLIVGAGDAGATLVREMQRSSSLQLDPIGFVDDGPANAHRQLYGVPVLGVTDDIPRLVSEHGVAEIIVAVPGMPGPELRRILALGDAAGVGVRTLPSVQELLDDTVTVNRVRPVRVEDLLRRDQHDIPDGPIRTLVSGKVVLVTGAGGSIGSELCRQIAAFDATKLVLFERGETPLFYADEELRRRFPSLEVVSVLGDVTRKEEVERAFREHAPAIVLHAAAHKHVPLSEQNPGPAVLTNIRGTRIVATIAAAHGVEALIFVSTDKAVDPSSIMGATKRVGESIVRHVGETARGRFVIVRFGNVMGSQGSVLELFRQQILDGGPVTVTHPDMTRYFMTIPEAVRLILLAGAVGERGAIHVLNMGQPIRILDLARELIRLSVPAGEKDIAIVFSGLRPGEKMEEVLFAPDEERLATDYPFLLMARPTHTSRGGLETPDPGGLETDTRELESIAESGDGAATRAALLAVLQPARSAVLPEA